MAVEPLVEVEPELGPEVEVVAKSVPQVGALAIFTVLLGILLAVDAICRAFFGTLTGAVGWIPYAGKVLSTPIDKIKNKVVDFLGRLVHEVETNIASHAHQFARLMEQFVRNLEYMAATFVLLGALVAGFTANVLLPKLERFVHTVIRKIEEEIRRVERITIQQGAHVTRVITHNVYPRIKGAEVSVQHVIEHQIKPLERLAREAEKTAVRAEKNISRLERHMGKKAWLALAVATLGQLAVDALRCTELGNLFKNRGRCNLWKDLGSLLGLFDVLIFLDVCAILEFLSPFVSDVAAPIVTTLTDIGAGLCKGGIGAPGLLQGQKPDIPGVYTGTPGLP